MRSFVLAAIVVAGTSSGPRALPDETAPILSFTATLVRQPYMQRVSATHATIVWATREPGAAEVRYQRDGDVLVAPASTSTYTAAYTGLAFDYYQHEVTLTELTPATTYAYELFHDGVDVTVDADQFTTAPPTGSGRVAFVAFGDSGSGTRNQQRVADSIAAEFAAGRWNLALHTGDVVYPKGSYQWLHDRFFAVYEDWLRRYPIFLAIGNHEDYVNKGRPYLDLFSLPDNGYTPVFPDQTERYYSFDYGPVHFIALDTQLAFAGDRLREQMNWLVRDLESTTQPWRIVFFHIPAYGSSDFASAMSKRAVLQPIFERYGVQLVLAGHEHAYARGVPWREPPSTAFPVVHVVTGGGGASLNDPVPGPWAAAWASAYHYVSVDVDACTPNDACALTLEAIDADRRVIDAFTLDLRAQGRDSGAPVVSIQSPASGAVLSDHVTISANAADDEQIMKVDLLVDGDLRAVDTAAPFTWTWDTTLEINGSRRLQLRAVDVAGHIGVSAPRMVTVANALPSLALLSPRPGERISTTTPYRIRWAAGAGDAPLTAFRVELAADGKTFEPIAACSGLPASARECNWNGPRPTASKAVVRVTVIDALARGSTVVSGPFRIDAKAASVSVTFPSKATTVGIGSTQSLAWSSSLGFNGQWNLEISRDGGASWAPLAPSFLSLDNTMRWVVTGPETSDGLFRVSSLDTEAQDVSDARFKIAQPVLALTGLNAATVWTAGTEVKVKWVSNLGAHDRLNIRLSVDGGMTFPIVLAAAVPATTRTAAVVVPWIATSRARVRVEALTNAAWSATNAADFRLVVP